MYFTDTLLQMAVYTVTMDYRWKIVYYRGHRIKCRWKIMYYRGHSMEYSWKDHALQRTNYRTVLHRHVTPTSAAIILREMKSEFRVYFWTWKPTVVVDGYGSSAWSSKPEKACFVKKKKRKRKINDVSLFQGESE